MLVTVEAPASFLVWRNGMTNFQWVITIGASLTVLYLIGHACAWFLSRGKVKEKKTKGYNSIE